MLCRCASVSRTLIGVTVAAAGLVSPRGEQPAQLRVAASSVKSAAAGAAFRRVRRGAVCGRSVSMMIRGEIRAVPPATAERLKERGGVGKAIGLGLHQGTQRLLIGLLGVEQCEIAGVAGLPLPLREIEGDLGGI